MSYVPVTPPQPEPKKPRSPANTAIVVVGVLVALWIVAPKSQPAPSSPVQPGPVVAPDELLGVKAVIGQVEDKAKVRMVGSLMSAMSEVVGRIDPVKSNDLREWIVDSQTYMVKGTSLEGGIGLGPELEKLFKSKFGMESRDFTPNEMAELSSLFASIADLCK